MSLNILYYVAQQSFYSKPYFIKYGQHTKFLAWLTNMANDLLLYMYSWSCLNTLQPTNKWHVLFYDILA